MIEYTNQKAVDAVAEDRSAMQRIASGETTLEEELAALDAKYFLSDVLDIETCNTCVHEKECDEIGGRQQGRGYGSACQPIFGEPPFYERRKK